MNNLKSLKLKAADKIARQEAATVIKGQNLAKINDEEAPRFYVLKLELDEGVEVFLSGAKPLIPLQASLVKAFDDLIKARLDSDWTLKQFWEWAKDFEGGLLMFTVGARGDFAKRIKDKTPWGQKYDHRPRILELKKPGKQLENTFYKTVLLYPDRAAEGFEVFTGSYKEIASLIISWWNQKTGKAGQEGDRNNDVQMLSGHPKIYLYFEEPREKDEKNPQRGRLSFRLMSETETSISVANIKKIASKIQEVFGKKEGYFWEKGKRYANYNHWELGYKLQILSPSVADGERMIKDILRIQSHVFVRSRMTYSQNQGEAEAFPKKPGKRRILGEEVDLPERRRSGKARFRYATVKLGSLSKEVIIVSVDSKHPTDLRFR
jgi:hypothetical protein